MHTGTSNSHSQFTCDAQLPLHSQRASSVAWAGMPVQRVANKRARTAEGEASAGVVALHRSRFIEWQPAGVVALAASGDGSVLAAAREDGDIELYETSTSYCFQVGDGAGPLLPDGAATAGLPVLRHAVRRPTRPPSPVCAPPPPPPALPSCSAFRATKTAA